MAELRFIPEFEYRYWNSEVSRYGRQDSNLAPPKYKDRTLPLCQPVEWKSSQKYIRTKQKGNKKNKEKMSLGDYSQIG